MAVQKETVFRWPLDDFEERFEKAVFQEEWESRDFAVAGVPKAKFYLCLYAKGDREKNKDDCAIYLCARDFHDHPWVRLKYEFRFENNERKLLEKRALEHKFLAAANNYGWYAFCTQTELCDLVKGNSSVVVCKVIPLDLMAHTEESAALDVLEKLAANFDSKKFADVEVRVQGKIFNVNKVVICSGSPVFDRMFTHTTKEKETGVVEINKEDADVIELLLRYLYSGKVEGLKDMAARLLPVADCYGVLHLTAVCLESLYNHVSVETVLRDLKLAYTHDHAGYFKEKLLQFAQKNFKLVRQHADWTPAFVEGNSQLVMDVVALLTP